jgi:hypothetical protein
MRRVIFGAVTVAVAALAAIGLIGRRRWAMRDEALPLEPAPPLGAAGAVGEDPVPDTRPASKTPPAVADPGFPAASAPTADTPKIPVARPRTRKAAPRPAKSALAAPAEPVKPAERGRTGRARRTGGG